MREGTAPLVRREDYTAPAFWIKTVDLTFDLDPAKTLVINKMTVEPNPGQSGAALRLDGEDITLTRVLVDGEGMRGTGWTLTAVATPGHTSNHLCFALEESGALFTGDHVMGWSTSVVVPPDGDMGDYMASLEKLMARDDVRYHSAHGAAIEKPKQLVRGMIGHRRQRENQILRLLGETARPVSGFIPDMYKGLDPRLIGAAEMSVTAHLIDLEKRGAVRREGEVWRVV